MLCTPSGKPRGNHVDATGQHCTSPWPCLPLPRHLGGPLRRSALVGAALVLAACSRPSGPIVIGLAGPFSQARGTSMLRAAELAVDQINARGGVRGRLLKLKPADDSGSENTALRVAEQLYADPAVVAVVGHLSSDPSKAAARVYGAGPSPLAMISPSACNPDLAGINPYFFRVCPSYVQQGPQPARSARETR